MMCRIAETSKESFLEQVTIHETYTERILKKLAEDIEVCNKKKYANYNEIREEQKELCWLLEQYDLTIRNQFGKIAKKPGVRKALMEDREVYGCREIERENNERREGKREGGKEREREREREREGKCS